MDNKWEERIRVVMLPKDTNMDGNVFGGVILSYIDLAAAEGARGISPTQRFVTRRFEAVDFTKPVFVGDTMVVETMAVRVGKTSVTIHAKVRARRKRSADWNEVTTAIVVMVAVNEEGTKRALVNRSSMWCPECGLYANSLTCSSNWKGCPGGHEWDMEKEDAGKTT